MATDPVCGMKVSEQIPAETSIHEGRKYFFCSEGCKQAFEKNPWRFIAPPAEKSATCQAPSPARSPNPPLHRSAVKPAAICQSPKLLNCEL